MFTIFVTVKRCEYYTLIKNINLIKSYKMNANFTSKNETSLNTLLPNFIKVANYSKINEVVNYHLYTKPSKELSPVNVAGCWTIKY